MKSRDVRDVKIEARLLPLLEQLFTEETEKCMLHVPPNEDRAELLRRDAEKAGINRAASFVAKKDPTASGCSRRTMRTASGCLRGGFGEVFPVLLGSLFLRNLSPRYLSPYEPKLLNEWRPYRGLASAT
jgi:hypothetical protein